MTTAKQDRLKGSIDTIKGKAKEVAGVITDDQQLKNQGSLDQVKGKLEKAKAGMKDAVHHIIDKT